MKNKQHNKKTTLRIKHMVCPRCIMVVRDELQRLGLEVLNVELGYAEANFPVLLDTQKIEEALKKFGFELLHDKEEVLVEEIKILVIEYLYYLENTKKPVALSAFLSGRLGKNYTYLSKLFSKVEGRTIQTYLMLQKTERVKELLDYNELNLSQIASKLGYSSVHYLSSQFKSITGQAVSSYKKREKVKRKPLNDL